MQISEKFKDQIILDIIDVLRIGEVTTYGAMARTLGFLESDDALELAHFIVDSREIPPCDGARVIHSNRDTARGVNITNNTNFKSYHPVLTRQEALHAAGVSCDLKSDEKSLMIDSKMVVGENELKLRVQQKFNSQRMR